MAKVTIHCEICGKAFDIFPCRKEKIKTCSSKCKGIKLSNRISLPQELRDKAVSMYQNGHSIRYVASAISVHATTIRIWLKKNGIKIHRNKYSIEKKSQALKLYKEGLSQKEVASKLGIGKKTIQRWTRTAKLSRPSFNPCGGGDTQRIYSMDERKRVSTEYFNWRSDVLCRDNWKCQHCGLVGDELHCHHILSYANNPLLRFDVNNGISLCKKCHYELHKHQRLEVAS